MKKVPKKKYQFSLMSRPDSFPLMKRKTEIFDTDQNPDRYRYGIKIESRIRISKIQDRHQIVAHPQHSLHKFLYYPVRYSVSSNKKSVKRSLDLRVVLVVLV